MKGEKKWREIGRNGKMNLKKGVLAVVLPHIGDLRFTLAPCKVLNVLPLSSLDGLLPLTALYPVKHTPPPPLCQPPLICDSFHYHSKNK